MKKQSRRMPGIFIYPWPGRARNQKKKKNDTAYTYSLIKRDIFIIQKHFSSELIFKGISNIILKVKKLAKYQRQTAMNEKILKDSTGGFLKMYDSTEGKHQKSR